jgi:uncharacterized membrane-anchored protein
MTRTTLDTVLHDAHAAGLLPADAAASITPARPWPIVLLTALGAWLAAIPLLGVIGLLLGDFVSRGNGAYLIGALVLAGAVVVLRSRDVPLFVEQLAVPGLLVGAGSLSFGLFRDLSTQGAAMVLALLAIGVAVVVGRSWLRVLLGAAAAMALALALTAHSEKDLFRLQLPQWWLSWHLVLAVLIAADALQSRLPARLATMLEPTSAGALLATLAALAWWSGSTLLLGASQDALLSELVFSHRSGWQAGTMQSVSALLAAAAALWLGRAWPSLRRTWCGGVALVCVVLAWFMPALGAALLVAALSAVAHRWRIAAAACLAAAWIVGSFYYQLAWPLATKAIVLVAAGAVLGALAWWAHGRAGASTAPPAPAAPPTAALSWTGIALTALAVLATANLGIWQKEQLIARGETVLVELAPVDPRSLMQGDYMRLNFRLPSDVLRHGDVLTSTRPHVVGKRDERGVTTLLRLDNGTPLASDERRIELTPKNGSWVLVSDAWFFKEGEAERWGKARYGEFRVEPGGRALLVGLRDGQLQPL